MTTLHLNFACAQMGSNVGYNFPIMKAIHSYNGTRFVYLYDYKSNFSTQLYKHNYKKYLGMLSSHFYAFVRLLNAILQ